MACELTKWESWVVVQFAVEEVRTELSAYETRCVLTIVDPGPDLVEELRSGNPYQAVLHLRGMGQISVVRLLDPWPSHAPHALESAQEAP